jgi:general secretion pathway protein K
MPRRFPPGSTDCRRNGGFALIIVLWTLVLIGFIVAHMTASGRTEIRIAGNLVANSASQAAADGAVFEAIFNLSDPQPEQRWPVDGTPRQVAIGSIRVILRVEDEASWINPSTASPALLEALLRVTGSDPDTARRIAIAISEWVGSAAVPRPQEALVADYRAAGLDYGPPSAPIETFSELGRVLGMTPAMLMAIRPHLTLFGPPEPNPATTDPVVATALTLSSTNGSSTNASSPAGQPVVQPGPATQPDSLIVRITALAAGPGNARVTRTAVVRTAVTLPQGYAVLAWSNSLDSDAPLGSPQPSFTR